MVDRRTTAEGDKKAPGKHGQDPATDSAEAKIIDTDQKTPSKLIDLASKELGQLSVSGGFKNLASDLQALKNGVLDLGVGAEKLLASTFSPSKTTDSPASNGDPKSVPSDGSNGIKVPPTSGDVKAPAPPGDGKAPAPPGDGKAPAPPGDGKAASISGDGTQAPVQPGGADIPPPAVPAPLDQAPAAPTPVPVDTPLQPIPVKTISIQGPAPGYTGSTTFQPASSFSSGPDTTQFSQTAPDTTTQNQSNQASITTLSVRTVDPSVALSSQNVLSDSTTSTTRPACDVGQQPLQPFNISQIQALSDNTQVQPQQQNQQAQQQQNQAQQPARVQDNGSQQQSPQNQNAMNNIMFNPTPIAEQRNLAAGTAASTGTQSSDTGHYANYSSSTPGRSEVDPKCQLAPGQSLQPLNLSDLNRNTINTTPQIDRNVAFNPTPIAQQQAPLGDSASKGDRPSNITDTARSSDSSRTAATGGGVQRETSSGAGKPTEPIAARPAEPGAARPTDQAVSTTAAKAASTDSHSTASKTEADPSASRPKSAPPPTESAQHPPAKTPEISAPHPAQKPEDANTHNQKAEPSNAKADLAKTTDKADASPKAANHNADTGSAARTLEKQALAYPAGKVSAAESQMPKSTHQPTDALTLAADSKPLKKAASDEQAFRSVGAYPAADLTPQKAQDIVASLSNLANTLARAAQPQSIVSSLDALGSKPGSQPGDANSAGRRGEQSLGPVSLASLSGKSAAAADGILGATAGSRSGGSDSSLGNTGRLGSTLLDTAIANASITNRGIFAGDQLGSIKAGLNNPLDSSGNKSTGLSVIQQGAFAPLPGGNGIIGAGAIRPGALNGTFVDATGRSVRIDALTGHLGEDGRPLNANALSLAEMQRIQRAVGEKRYLTGVEIAVACAIASVAMAKSRNNQTPSPDAAHPGEGNLAAKDLKALLEEVEPQDSSSSAAGAVLKSATVYKRPTVIIAHNDSLVEIAERIFQDADVAWLIADINVGRISEHTEDGKRIVELRSRQEIELPHPSEVEAFLLGKEKDAKAENMVTIVAVTEIDRELLDSFLSTVVGGEMPSTTGRPSALPVLSIPEQDIDIEPDFKPLMHLVDFGLSIGKSLMPTMNAIVNKGLNLKTYISKIDMIPPSPIVVRSLEPEPQR